MFCCLSVIEQAVEIDRDGSATVLGKTRFSANRCRRSRGGRGRAETVSEKIRNDQTESSQFERSNNIAPAVGEIGKSMEEKKRGSLRNTWRRWMVEVVVPTLGRGGMRVGRRCGERCNVESRCCDVQHDVDGACGVMVLNKEVQLVDSRMMGKTGSRRM